MEFIQIKSTQDQWYQPTLDFYLGKLDDLVTEDESVFVQSLKTEKTKNDYVFLVGIEDDRVVSFATAHYEATTNAGFIIYLLAEEGPQRESYLEATLHQTETNINALAQQLHGRDVNFFMFESTFESPDVDSKTADDIAFRRRFLTQQGFEKQTKLSYIQPSLNRNGKPVPLDLYIKTNIPLTKDIYGASIKSCYILKYVFANRLPRKVIYPLLVKMDLRKEPSA
ncbi:MULTISPECIES: hypothetical protein [unclassified Staphylococcus]|uniref:hypothetical protein n=1 Tax=unclassified Staphylococcus TaxID=91994 RepID=UPI0021D0BDB0|nr:MULTISPECIES: hypothetical protein [unclassified Staphylococcus]UXR71609.1 hypothetical protein MUA88_10660 [Staphylococcus sp. IVB6240]UXR73883.1 hypothetical protein MUA48_11170 [Staphylococcus sp. IVB6238]UXR76206.1 hypothetical protein MUA74_11270 [Staphylococcus sp. IVB6233]UXR80403.1 hypothetical protein MUA65_10875 [Staphylococcus sp. IVB6218]